ncbi:alginate lyase-domain-containing protein [Mycena sp. CBHHK59/15]|nr:alginate lyase-domain-containing protein [Mycena sp. CBHHK59/15]
MSKTYRRFISHISVAADPTDWVNIEYVLGRSQSLTSQPSTSDAQNSIIQSARSSTMDGPWSVTNSEGVVAPSGDPHDYLSWAPYHWPDCNWCSKTWTTCPYVARDGQVNPDVRTLNGPGAINSVGQSILYNSLCFVFGASTASTCSQNAARFIDAFFLTPSTMMNPNMNFGQIVRGPGPNGREGTFTGILDLRAMVKIVNGISLLKAARSPAWTSKRDQAMGQWVASYSGWLKDSELGKNTASRANNHASFYFAQLVSTQILNGDNVAATDSLELFSKIPSGEQPLEAVRTRPYHYRCFNLEALITLAKLGDQLGLNLWTAKSKYQATIQTAVDYVMKTDPKSEDVTEVVPHIAAAAAAYGDPDGKYASFMRKTMPNYQSKPFWFYDQTDALPRSPAAQKRTGRDTAQNVTDALPVKFDCPWDEVLPDGAKGVQLDNDIYASCDELRPLYETVGRGE